MKVILAKQVIKWGYFMRLVANRSKSEILKYYSFLLDSFSRFPSEIKLFPPNLSSLSDSSKKPSEALLKHYAKEIKNQSELNLEFGVWKGRSLKLLAEELNPKKIYGFDSFKSFPEDGRIDTWDYDFSLAKLPIVPTNVELIEGYYDKTLETFLTALNIDKVKIFAHIDCDIYSSTSFVLKTLGEYIEIGSVIIFDELLNHDRILENEFLAFFEFLDFHNLDFQWLGALSENMGLHEFCKMKSTNQLPKTMAGFRKQGLWQAAAIHIVSRNSTYTSRIASFDHQAKELANEYLPNQPIRQNWEPKRGHFK